MGRLELCTDEHVPDSYFTALQSNGFRVVAAMDERGDQTIDEKLLRWCADEGFVLLTNDRDFVRLDGTIDHAGVILYATQNLGAGAVARGVRRIDRQLDPDEMGNRLEWLEHWL